MNITDPIEQIVADALDKAGVEYIHDSQPGHDTGVDFFLHKGVAVECKQFYSPRADKSLAKNSNIILIQGRKAAETFAALIGRKP